MRNYHIRFESRLVRENVSVEFHHFLGVAGMPRRIPGAQLDLKIWLKNSHKLIEIQKKIAQIFIQFTNKFFKSFKKENAILREYNLFGQYIKIYYNPRYTYSSATAFWEAL